MFSNLCGLKINQICYRFLEIYCLNFLIVLPLSWVGGLKLFTKHFSCPQPVVSFLKKTLKWYISRPSIIQLKTKVGYYQGPAALTTFSHDVYMSFSLSLIVSHLKKLQSQPLNFYFTLRNSQNIQLLFRSYCLTNSHPRSFDKAAITAATNWMASRKLN